MKLISCYISGYGALRNRTINFNEGITQQLEGNGIGKTTLASFVKAMLYGMDGYRAGAKDFKDREHFFPFDGEAYGGALTLEHRGSIYKIERSFDGKSEKKDKTTVYRDNVQISEHDTLNVGETLLGVNKESFERTLFITADDIEIAATTDIRTKMETVAQGVVDDSSYENAVKLLENSIKEYKPSKNVQNSPAHIPRLRDKIEQIKQNITNAERIREAIEEKYRRETELRERLSVIKASINAENERARRQAERAAYDRICGEISDAEGKEAELKGKYPHGIPSDEELRLLRSLGIERRTLEGSVFAFTADEQGRLSVLKKRFAEGEPHEAELNAVSEKIEARRKKAEERERLEGYAQTEEEITIRRRFASHRPSESEISAAEAHRTRYSEAVEALEKTPPFITSDVPAVSGISPVPYIVLAVISAIAIVFGVVLLTINVIGFGAALLAIGAVILAISGFLYLNKKTTAISPQPIGTVNPDYELLKGKKEIAEEALRNFLKPFGYESAQELVLLSRDVKKLEEYLNGEKERSNRIEELKAELAKIDSELCRFFLEYGVEGTEYGRLLTELRVDIESYKALLKREKDAVNAQSETQKRMNEIDSEIERIESKYSIHSIDADDISADKRELSKIRDEIEKKTKEAEKYRLNHSIYDDKNPIENTEAVDTEQLELAEREYSGQLAALEKEIGSDEAEIEKIDGYYAELSEAREELSGCEKTHELLSVAKELLERANEEMNKRYVAPVLNEFTANADRLGDAIGRPMTINREFEILFEQDGKYYGEKYLSAGQRTLCALCFRLSLIKNMYGNELPFVIMDDPFSALDEKNMDRARGILSQLAKETQILYFTCHGSRTII